MRRMQAVGRAALCTAALQPSSLLASPPQGQRRQAAFNAAPKKPSGLRSFFRLADMYSPGKYTSKDLPKGPGASNQPWDPVYANYAFRKATGPLERKQNTTPDDHLTVEEVEKWMDATAAAKVLGIKESELPTLTSTQLEERWAKVYGERANALQQETVIAAEVLLEYIDSSLHRKKSRQYYRQYVDNARHAIDHEIDLRRQGHRQKFTYVFGVAMLTGCSVVMCIAFFRDIITRRDVENIGANAVAYLSMAFTQATNPEPAPDYSTRYRNTPTAMEIDQREGNFGHADPARAQLAAEVEEYRRQEEAEMLRMFNDENERAQKEAKVREVRGSRVRVYRPEDFDEAGELKEPAPPKNELDPAAAFSQMTFRQFAAMMASQFGGGSRFQRITQDSVRRTEEMEKMRKRMDETNV
ncbi:uncharacterized protein Tco025E_00147 [Trypanosoma conorhini]|uniref:Transmembrane protein n=1 Tax=Trypanosoma conorhini TaxID=83891 RepID=A0A3R7NV64_9TRYP|nr:uncharacterized protein Tco025E_00147 [Trypanosoma conorhini]RNF27586.1 hypothetical protein Tco025E_00147 [Trypanosoma conorhini]